MAISAVCGCGNSQSSDSSSSNSSSAFVSDDSNSSGSTIASAGETADTEEAGSQEASSDNEVPSVGYNVTWDDIAEITVIYPSMNTIQAGLGAVEDAINEITEAEINTHVTLTMIEVGNYGVLAKTNAPQHNKSAATITNTMPIASLNILNTPLPIAPSGRPIFGALPIITAARPL